MAANARSSPSRASATSRSSGSPTRTPGPASPTRPRRCVSTCTPTTRSSHGPVPRFDRGCDLLRGRASGIPPRVARAPEPKPHGHFLAGEAGELAGVSGSTIGQWARWGYIRPSQSDGDPHVYSVEDVAEAAIVHDLLERGVRHVDVRRAVQRLGKYGAWPLSEAPLATTAEGQPRIVLRENGNTYEISPRGWQLMSSPPRLEDVRLRLRRS